MLSPEPSDEARRVARSAARWWVCIESGAVSEQDLARLQRWREASDAHESAWRRVSALKGRFQILPPALAMASLDRPAPGRRDMLKGLLGVAVVAPAGWWLARELPLDAWRADEATGTGERRRLTLADGSVLHINTSTAVDIDAEKRQLTLRRGEFMLRLADATPFHIRTALTDVRLDQGEINVREGSGVCRLSVLAGQAEVRPTGFAALTLRAGQRIQLSDAGPGPITGFDPRQPGWREGVIVALNQPLGEFLRELDRYRPGILRWQPELEALRVTGSFRLDEPDQVLNLLAVSLPLSVQWRTRYWATLVPQEKSA
ncbi:FecR domain-containing protein [Pseudomonas sp. CFBP 8758]|uniref:FecR domain-containing protein n=1 Tax=Pseudomonas sp. CFBP 8758 TaxID=2775286 RepID=UPI00178730FE|nr:FecR domain-containing protein [Pseudomonas sp. CFBP 8758]